MIIAESACKYFIMIVLILLVLTIHYVMYIGQQDLPKTIPVAIKLPSDLFGEMMMVLEFLNVFGSLFDIKDEFPNGLTFGEHASHSVL